MSALNMIVQGQHAHLLTDRAVYDRNGIVVGIGHKVVRVEVLPLALAIVGVFNVDQVASAVETSCPTTSLCPEDWVARLPAVVRWIREENLTRWPEIEGTADGEITLAAIYYSHRLGRARGVMVSSGDPSLPAYEVVGLSCIAIPAIEIEPGIPDPSRAQFDPRRDGVALVEAQRQGARMDGMVTVGGGVDLTTVGPEGLTLETLHTWPDEIGRRIDRERAVSL